MDRQAGFSGTPNDEVPNVTGDKKNMQRRVSFQVVDSRSRRSDALRSSSPSALPPRQTLVNHPSFRSRDGSVGSRSNARRRRGISLMPTSSQKQNADSEAEASGEGVAGAQISLLAPSSTSRIAQSWSIVSDNMEDVGLDFMSRVFAELPDILQLFPFAKKKDGTHPSVQGMDQMEIYELFVGGSVPWTRMVKAHAVVIMKEFETCVAGGTEVEDMIPRLRSLGRMHGAAGVKLEHYDVFFRHLLETIQDHVGPEVWTDETEHAWRLVESSMSTIMKSPADLMIDVDAAGGWAIVTAVASAYTVVATPYRLAGISMWCTPLNVVMNMLDVVIAAVFGMELLAWWILPRVRLPNREKIKGIKNDTLRRIMNRKRRSSSVTDMLIGVGDLLKVNVGEIIYSLGIDQVMNWPRLDAAVLLSFLIQGIQDLRSWSTAYELVGAGSQALGVHWSWSLGLVRVAALLRLLHALRCYENGFAFRQARADRRFRLRFIRLALTLVYVLHLSACLWCITARVGWGAGGTASSTPFFPVVDILLGSTDNTGLNINGYIRSLHWAWVQLAGIGNSESVPVTSLECLLTLAVHLCGATLYAITTGNVVSMLEDATARENELGSEAAELSDFMSESKVPPKIQNKIMQGYVMSNALGQEAGGLGGTFLGAGEPQPVMPFPEEVAAKLPWHLQRELRVHSLADVMGRRDPVMGQCSREFLHALAGSMRDTSRLLAGDYLFQQSDPCPQRFYVVEKGSLALLVDGVTTRTLRRGDILGITWISVALRTADDDGDHLNVSNEGSTTQEESTEKSNSLSSSRRSSFGDRPASSSGGNIFDQFKWGDHAVRASVRALESCTLAAGLEMQYEVWELSRRFPSDFAKIEAERERAMMVAERQGSFVGVMGAIRAKNVLKGMLKSKSKENEKSGDEIEFGKKDGEEKDKDELAIERMYGEKQSKEEEKDEDELLIEKLYGGD